MQNSESKGKKKWFLSTNFLATEVKIILKNPSDTYQVTYSRIFFWIEASRRKSENINILKTVKTGL